MEKKSIVSRILGIYFNEETHNLKITLADSFEGYKIVDDQYKKTQVNYFWCYPEPFYLACLHSNKDFHPYVLWDDEMDRPQGKLYTMCVGAEITLTREECPNEQKGGTYFNTYISSVTLSPERIPELQKMEASSREKSNSAFSEEFSPEKEACKAILEKNEINCLYHFTDYRNFESIKSNEALYSWFYCEMNGISIPFRSGDELSRSLDVKYRLHDYVRLSFCESHPMSKHLEEEGFKMVHFKVDPQVALWKDTQFSDMNAADSGHHHGWGPDMLQQVKFDVVKRNDVRWLSVSDFKGHQAEVMVKTWIPLKYILNLDEVEACVAELEKKLE